MKFGVQPLASAQEKGERMASSGEATYRFGAFQLDAAERLLLRDGQPVSLTPKAFDLLVYLVEHQGRLVEKAEMMAALWPDTIVEEANLAFQISALRKALSDDREDTKCIETVPTRGYRFVAPVVGNEPSPVRLPIPNSRWWLGTAVALVGIVASLAAWQLRPTPATVGPTAPMRVVPVTTLAGDEGRASFSPDGSHAAFFWTGETATDGHIRLILLGSPETRRLTDGPFDTYPSWSPDGSQVAFLRVRFGEYDGARLYVVSPLGGPALKLSDFRAWGQLAWSPDNRYLAAARRGPEGDRGIYLIPVQGGAPRAVTHQRAPRLDVGPAFSPDGRYLAYSTCTPGCDVYVVALDEAFGVIAQPRRLTTQGLRGVFALAWTRDGRSVVYDSLVGPFLTYLWRVDVDGTKPPARVELAGLGASDPAIARGADRLVFTRASTIAQVVSLRPGAKPETIFTSSATDYDPQFSPDGRRVVFASSRSGDASEIWITTADGSVRRLGHGQGQWQRAPQWSPDGQRITFDSLGDDGHFHIWTVDAEGGASRQLTVGTGSQELAAWSHDGEWIYFTGDEGTESAIWRMPAKGGPAVRLKGTEGALRAFETLDGKSVVYQPGNEQDTQTSPLMIAPIAGGPSRQLIRCAVINGFNVTPAGLYYVACDTNWHDFALHLFDTRAGEDRVISTLEGYYPTSPVTVAPDGTILYVQRHDQGSNLFAIENFR